MSLRKKNVLGIKCKNTRPKQIKERKKNNLDGDQTYIITGKGIPGDVRFAQTKKEKNEHPKNSKTTPS